MTTSHPNDAQRTAITVTMGLAIWTGAWVASLALARFGPEHLWDSTTVSWIAVAINVAFGVGLIFAHVRYLRGIDEMQRKIMQDALAVTLGAGWVAGFGYVVADAAGLISGDVSLGTFAAMLSVVYILAVALGHLRYR